jgi:phenylpyruvate tautomerase PptA (4-oxalocrotonate tautomerase family)
MPIVRIDLSDKRSREQRRAVSDAVHRAFVEAVGIPEGDRFHVITTHPAQELIVDPEYLDVAREDVVFIQITLIQGRSNALKQQLYKALVRQVVEAGVRAEDVAVVLTENGPADYSWGNGDAQVLAMEPVPGTSADEPTEDRCLLVRHAL